jgi:5-methylcytosine-specific restriction endonuclease McrA
VSVSKRLRYEVLRRDDHACRYCGHTAPDVPLTVDHVIPVALGGTDEPENLVTACKDCNAGKSWLTTTGSARSSGSRPASAAGPTRRRRSRSTC